MKQARPPAAAEEDFVGHRMTGQPCAYCTYTHLPPHPTPTSCGPASLCESVSCQSCAGSVHKAQSTPPPALWAGAGPPKDKHRPRPHRAPSVSGAGPARAALWKRVQRACGGTQGFQGAKRHLGDTGRCHPGGLNQCPGVSARGQPSDVGCLDTVTSAQAKGKCTPPCPKSRENPRHGKSLTQRLSKCNVLSFHFPHDKLVLCLVPYSLDATSSFVE